jgi:hypothetical protein
MGNVQLNDDVIEAMFRDPAGPVGRIIEKKCIAVETLAKILVVTPGSGRMYQAGPYFLRRGDKVYHWVRTTAHQASAPGEPPSSDTGRLLTAITHRMDVEDKIVGRVVANVNYALYLELGTRYMEPRPFLRPALSGGMKS